MSIRERIATPGSTGTRLPPVIVAARTRRPRAVAVAIALAALAGTAAGCGDDSDPPTSPAPVESENGDRDAGERARGDRGTDDRPGRERPAAGSSAPPSDDRQMESEPPPNASNAHGECIFEAPPGRLAEERIVVELEGIGCEQGRRLARAVALGQPAGANLEFDAAGFRCRPSTPRKGANVTYSCEGEAGRATFDVVWSSG
jgi:hypothetical protein